MMECKEIITEYLTGNTKPDEYSPTALLRPKEEIEVSSFIANDIIANVKCLDEEIGLLKEGLKKKKEFGEKCLRLYMLMNNWLAIKQRGKKVTSYFHNHDIHKVIIYGMHYVGERLYDELENTEVEVVLGIDKTIEGKYKDLRIVKSGEVFPQVDAIIVTPITYYEEIKSDLSGKTHCQVISVESVINEVRESDDVCDKRL